jgi:hypothetical protein
MLIIRDLVAVVGIIFFSKDYLVGEVRVSNNQMLLKVAIPSLDLPEAPLNLGHALMQCGEIERYVTGYCLNLLPRGDRRAPHVVLILKEIINLKIIIFP